MTSDDTAKAAIPAAGGKGSVDDPVRVHVPDLAAGRTATDPFPLSHKLERLAWQVCWLLLARWTPPGLRGWRRWLLRRFGAIMTDTSEVRASARVWYPRNLRMGKRSILANEVNCYNQAPVWIGDDVVVSQGAHLCTGSHRTDDPAFTWFAKEIRVGDRAWLAAECFVGPGVTIGDGAVLGARAAAFRAIAPYTINIGNPAVRIRDRRLPDALGG